MSPGTLNPFSPTPLLYQAMSSGQTHLSVPAHQFAFRGRKSESSHCWPYCFTDYWLQVIRFQQFKGIRLWKRKAERKNEPIRRTRAQLQENFEWQTCDWCDVMWRYSSEKSVCNLSCAARSLQHTSVPCREGNAGKDHSKGWAGQVSTSKGSKQRSSVFLPVDPCSPYALVQREQEAPSEAEPGWRTMWVGMNTSSTSSEPSLFSSHNQVNLIRRHPAKNSLHLPAPLSFP